MDHLHHCYFCGYETATLSDLCPRCSRPFLVPRQIRRRGWILTLLGSAMAFSMGWLSFIMLRLIYFPDPDATDRFDGGPADAFLVMSVLYLVVSFGLVAMVAGLWQIRTGRKNRKFAMIIGVIALLLFVLGTFITGFLS